MLHTEYLQAPAVCYDQTLQQCGTAERAEKYFRRFYDDQTFTNALRALESNDHAQLKQHIHTLRGLALNLGMAELASRAEQLDHQLRDAPAGGLAQSTVEAKFSSIEQAYFDVVSILTMALEE